MAQITYIENNPFGFFDPEASRPISIDTVQESTTPVHRIEIVSGPRGSQVQFTEAIPIKFYVNDSCDLEIDDRWFSLSCFRGSIRIDKNSDCVSRERDTLVKVEYPWSNRRIGQGKVLSYCSKLADFEKKVHARLAQSLQATGIKKSQSSEYESLCRESVRQTAEDTNYFPWESRKNYLSAPIYEQNYLPFSSFRKYTIQDLVAKSRSSEKGKRKQKNNKTCWLLAIVRDIEEVRKVLACSRRISSLLDDAENGKLKVMNHQKGGDFRTTSVCREFADVSIESMELAITQALGGPVESVDEWIQLHNGNANVEELVARIFLSYAANYQRYILKNSSPMPIAEVNNSDEEEEDFYLDSFWRDDEL